jgi:hypothetical protein
MQRQATHLDLRLSLLLGLALRSADLERGLGLLRAGERGLGLSLDLYTGSAGGACKFGKTRKASLSWTLCVAAVWLRPGSSSSCKPRQMPVNVARSS